MQPSGTDAVIEALASITMVWRFSGARTVSQTAERRAQHHPRSQRCRVAGVSQQFFGDLPFADLRVGQAPGHWHALRGGQ
jgi:hypothetical protein